MTSASAYADVETSSAGYAARFAGAAGEWLLAVQARIFINQLIGITAALKKPITLLDVGGGHGQIVQALADASVLPNSRVTVLGSSQACEDRLRPFVVSGQCAFKVGDLLKLPFADRSFDVVTSFRFIPHCDEWRTHIAELCRVAKHAVVVDYPTYESVNCLSPLLFRLKKKFERNTRTYTLFSNTQIRSAFAAAGYKITKRDGEFFLPMVVHRALKIRRPLRRLSFHSGLRCLQSYSGRRLLHALYPKILSSYSLSSLSPL